MDRIPGPLTVVATSLHRSQTWQKEWEPGEGSGGLGKGAGTGEGSGSLGEGAGAGEPWPPLCSQGPVGCSSPAPLTPAFAIMCRGPCPGLCCGSMFFAHLPVFSSAPLKLQ